VRPKVHRKNGIYRFYRENSKVRTVPKLLDRLPRLRHHRASGLAVVSLNGRDFYCGPWRSKTSRLRYDQLIGEWLANQRRLPDDNKSDFDINELIAAHWKFASTYYVKDGRPTCLSGIKVALRFLRSSYGHVLTRDFGPLGLRAIQERMVAAGQSRRYINGNIDHIRRCFKWGVAQEMVPVAVYQSLKTVPGLKRGRTTARECLPIKPVADDIVDATLPFLPPVIVDMVRFQRLVGCRPGEVCDLRPCDVDTSGDIWHYRPRSHKAEHHNRQRVISIGPKAQDVLRSYLLRDKAACCFSPAESRRKQYAQMREARKTKVQPSQVDRSKAHPQNSPGDCYSKDSYNRAIHRACLNADQAAHAADPSVPSDHVLVPVWSPNRLRHSVGTKVRKKFGLEAAQCVLGHSKADVTQVYAERDEKLADAVAREVG
jgi:integrase